MSMPPEESISFRRKTDNIKKLLRAACAQYPKHMEIGLALITAGKELANERKIVSHWVASRSSSGIQFAKIQLPPAPISAEHSHWTTEELFDLADHIADWGTDLNRFWLALIIDGPLASNTTWHGPKPQDQTLDSDTRTIGKSRRTSTRRKTATPALTTWGGTDCIAFSISSVTGLSLSIGLHSYHEREATQTRAGSDPVRRCTAADLERTTAAAEGKT